MVSLNIYFKASIWKFKNNFENWKHKWGWKRLNIFYSIRLSNHYLKNFYFTEIIPDKLFLRLTSFTFLFLGVKKDQYVIHFFVNWFLGVKSYLSFISSCWVLVCVSSQFTDSKTIDLISFIRFKYDFTTRLNAKFCWNWNSKTVYRRVLIRTIFIHPWFWPLWYYPSWSKKCHLFKTLSSSQYYAL